MRAEFEKTHLANEKELVGRVAKMGETKKAMPFVQALRKRLVQGGEKPEHVFERKLAFDELGTLKEMVAGLRRTTGCKAVDVVAVEEGGNGRVVVGDGEGGIREGLGSSAEAAVPGCPTFQFENV